MHLVGRLQQGQHRADLVSTGPSDSGVLVRAEPWVCSGLKGLHFMREVMLSEGRA